MLAPFNPSVESFAPRSELFCTDPRVSLVEGLLCHSGIIVGSSAGSLGVVALRVRRHLSKARRWAVGWRRSKGQSKACRHFSPCTERYCAAVATAARGQLPQ
jgi:hypothetical protein